MHMHEAMWLAQQFVGHDKIPIACNYIPDGLYLTDALRDDLRNSYIFTVVEKKPSRVGEGEHVAVNKSTGAVTHLGFSGE